MGTITVTSGGGGIVGDGASLGQGHDLLIIGGQSENGAGTTATVDATHFDVTNPRVRQWGLKTYPGVVSAAAEPLDFNWNASFGLSPFNAWALEYLRWVAPCRDLLLIPAAVGSSGFGTTASSSWKTTVSGNLAQVAVAAAQAALAGAPGNNRIVGMSWLQGQASSGPQATYAGLLDDLIDYVRTALGDPDLPFFIAQMLPEWIDNHVGTADLVDAAQVDTPRRKYRTGYTESPRGYNIETVTPTHMNAAGQRIRGARMFDAFLRARANTAASDLLAPGTISFAQSGTSLAATWVRPLGHITGYQVEIQHEGGSWATVTHSDLTNTHTFTGLTVGDNYQVRVSSLRDAAVSDPSTAAFTMGDVPAAPTGLTSPTQTGSSVGLTWDATTGATSYLVEYKDHSSGTWLTGGTVASPAAAVSGLASETSYDFRVSAVNAAGAGTPSSTLTVSTTAAGVLFDSILTAGMWGYSVARRLRAGYTAPLIRVRRSSDNTEQDIGVAAGGVLDETALTTFVGAGDGFITKIYNQIAGGPDLIQPTNSKQPRIALAGIIDKVNSKPAARFDGVDDLMYHASPALWAQGTAGVTISLAAKVLAAPARNKIIAETHSGSATARVFYFGPDTSGNNAGGEIINDANTQTTAFNVASLPLTDALHSWTLTDSGTSMLMYRDGTANGTWNTTRSGVYTLDRFVLGGAIEATDVLQTNMSFAELCVWPTVLGSSDRATIRASRQAFYLTP